jgi:hypothetical protein
MVDKYISLPLFADPYYSYPIALQGNSYILEFIYSERTQLYSLNLFDSESNPIVVGEALVPNYPIFKDYAIFPLTGFFWMEEKADIISEPYKAYPDSLDQYYNLYYLYSE